MSSPEYSPEELTELLSGLMPEIPGYRVMRLLGRGGMSYVYLGVQESLDRQVAIKVIRPDALRDELSKVRFEKEARTIAKLQHPCIVGIHEVGRTEHGLMFYVMPYLSRGHVGQLDLTQNEPRVNEVLRSLLCALDYAHVRGIVHRDVKAENVLFDNADRPVLADFGIAMSRRDRARITGAGYAVGSCPHMAPEQARGEKVDGRADLYSVGVLAFELLCGRLPYNHPDSLAMALMHATDPIPRLPPAKQHWQAFIDQAMAKSPDARFANAMEMLAALEQVESARPRAWPTVVRPAKDLAPGRALDWLARLQGWRRPAAAVLGGFVLVAAWAGLWPDASPPPNAASVTAEAPVPLPPSNEASRMPVLAEATQEGPMPSEPAVADVVSEAPAAEPVANAAPATLPAIGPSEQALAAARDQIARHRLTQPRGDNALESLQTAARLTPRSSELAALGERWLGAATPYLRDALGNGNATTARMLFDGGRGLAESLALKKTQAWSAFHQAAAAPLLQRMRDAVAGKDVAGIRAAKRQAQEWGIASAALEPYISQPLVLAEAGDPIERGGTRLVLARLPAGGTPGLAVMAHAVTQEAYAAFVAATARQPANCRIRTALMTLRRRRWDAPGFEQAGDHPVVCVSLADAEAYAEWLGRRDGVRYRLPNAAEWRALVALPSAVSACKAGSIACGQAGTLAADAGSAVRANLHAMHGNVREWGSDCARSCRQRAALGYGWRDAAARGTAPDATMVDAGYGYDDLGFRLVHEVAGEALEVRP